jgi:broad specificity phosphatase PhoE
MKKREKGPTSFSAVVEVEQDSNLSEPGLDDLGRQQCNKLAVNLAQASCTTSLPQLKIILTSPLARALETTELGIATLSPFVRLIVLKPLREGITGVAKNKRRSKWWIKENFPTFNMDDVDESDLLRTTHDSPERKETYEDIWNRVQGLLAYVYETYEQDEQALAILLMTHCYVELTIQREITSWDVPEDDRTEAVEFFVGEAGGYATIVKGTRI